MAWKVKKEMPSGNGIAGMAAVAAASTGAIALTLAIAKLAYLNTASVARLMNMAAARYRLRTAVVVDPAIAMPKPQFASTDASTRTT